MKKVVVIAHCSADSHMGYERVRQNIELIIGFSPYSLAEIAVLVFREIVL